MNPRRGALRGTPRRHTLISRKPPSSPTVVAMPKTEMSRFPIHDDLTAPEESLPILKGASSAAGQLPNFLGVLAGAPAALKAYVRFRAELRHGALPRHSAERIGLAVAEHYGSKPGLQLHHAHGPPGRPRHRRGRPRQALGLRRRRARPRCCATCARCSATARSSRSTCTRRRARPAGATSSCSRRSRCSPWNPSPRWSTSPATCRSTARSRRRGCCARHEMTDRRRQPSASAARATTRLSNSSASAGPGAILYVLLHGGRMRFTEIANSVEDLERPAAVRAHEGARGARDRRAPRDDGHADQGLLRADRQGPRARAGDGRAQDVGGPLVGLTWT